jgi:ParB-like chromosome segregation protein Spo0J
MQHTTQPTSLEAELNDHRLFPHEPPAAVDKLAREDQLPYQLAGSEPDAALVHLAERYGLPNRVLVAPAEAREDGEVDGEFRVLDDARWVQAAREAGLDSVPVRVLDVSGLAAELLTLVLGQPRPANVAAQVDALETLLAAGIPEGEIARAASMSAAKVKRLALLMELEPTLRQALRDSRIKAPVAFTAAGLPGDIQAELAATFEREGQLTGTQVRQVRERMGAADAEAAASEAEAGAADGDANGAVAPPGVDPSDRLRRQAEELLDTLHRSDLPEELGARLAAVLEDIQRVPVA